MRSVVTTHPALIRDTLALLLLVAAMPFPASLRLDLSDHATLPTDDYGRSQWGWLNFVVFLLCIPADYVAGGKGLYVLLLLALPDAITWTRRIARHHRVAPAGAGATSPPRR